MRGETRADRLADRRGVQLLRFVLVGVANTAVYYAVYRLLLLLLPYLAAHVLAWAISVVFSFYANARFTYRVRPTLRKLAAFPLSSIANLMFTSIGSVILIDWAGWDERVAPLILGIAAVPITFGITTLVLAPMRGRPTDDSHGPGSTSGVGLSISERGAGR